MGRKKIIIWILCAAMSQMAHNTVTGDLWETERAQTEAAAGRSMYQRTESAQPEYIITEQHFLSFADMGPGEERSQVFSIWNTGEEDAAYYFDIQAGENMAWELTKAGDFYSCGKVLQNSLKLTELTPNEHIVFQLTVKNTGDSIETAVPVFSRE